MHVYTACPEKGHNLYLTKQIDKSLPLEKNSSDYYVSDAKMLFNSK